MNYFSTQPINWGLWTPQDIIFKSNQTIKKLMPQENILSYKSKNDRDVQMCKLTGGQTLTSHRGTYHNNNKYKAVHVHLRDVKSDFPNANIDFVYCLERKNSVGHALGGVNALMYLNSYHRLWQWQKDQNGNYKRVFHGDTADVDEGYRFSYGGQGESCPLNYKEFSEMLEITEAIRRFLVEVLIPYKNGEQVRLVA
jgi:hypothetical protein